jgi:hypothetical protein
LVNPGTGLYVGIVKVLLARSDRRFAAKSGSWPLLVKRRHASVIFGEWSVFPVATGSRQPSPYERITKSGQEFESMSKENALGRFYG